MASVKQLCKKGIVLDRGQVGMIGDVSNAINFYKEQGILKENKALKELIKLKHAALTIDEVLINGKSDAIIEIDVEENTLDVEIIGYLAEPIQFNIELKILTLEGVLVSFYSPGHMDGEILSFNKGKFSFKDSLHLPEFMVNGEYAISIELNYPNIERYLVIDGISLIKHGKTKAAGKPINYNEFGFFLINRNGK